MSTEMLPLSIQGELMLLHPARAVIWPRLRTVIVADTHFGKTDHFGRHGIAVPAGSDEADRRRLNSLLEAAEAQRLVILGDFVHAPLVDGSAAADDLRAWADALADRVEIHVVAGNHDRGADRGRPLPLHWRDSWILPPFRLVHDAERAGVSSSLFTLSGHLHPVVRLKGLKQTGVRVPVFWQKADRLILPSFGVFTGGFAVNPGRGEQIHAVHPGGIVSLSRA